MLALHLGLRCAPAAIVGFSGLLADPPPAEGPKVPILLTHGSADEVIPAGAMFAAAASLGAAGFAVQWHLAPGMGHGIDEKSLSLAGNFLALALAGRLESKGPLSSPL
jgi:phospholipase/carboxylesterase